MSKRLAAWALALAGCSAASDRSSGAPALILRVATDLAVPTAIDRLEIRVETGGATTFEKSYVLPGDASLPATLTLGASGKGTPPPGTLSPGIVSVADVGASVVLHVSASHAGVPVVSRAARFVMPSSQRALDVSLLHACSGVMCPDGQTCDHGSCVPVDVDAASLPGFGT